MLEAYLYIKPSALTLRNFPYLPKKKTNTYPLTGGAPFSLHFRHLCRCQIFVLNVGAIYNSWTDNLEHLIQGGSSDKVADTIKVLSWQFAV